LAQALRHLLVQNGTGNGQVFSGHELLLNTKNSYNATNFRANALDKCILNTKNKPIRKASLPMLVTNFHPTGRHFLQIPGPSPVPDRILRAISSPTIDHRGPEFGALGLKVLADVQKIFKTRHPVMIYPASGTGAWEAALSNVLQAGATACKPT
jgi:hypothetical protein